MDIIKVTPYDPNTCDEKYLTDVWRLLKDKKKTCGSHIEHDGERYRNAFDGKTFTLWCSQQGITQDEEECMQLCKTMCESVFISEIEAKNTGNFQLDAFYVRSSGARAAHAKSKRRYTEPIDMDHQQPTTKPGDVVLPTPPPRNESDDEDEEI